MASINVCWHEGANSQDNRCWLGMTTLLNNAFDAVSAEKETLIHRNTMAEMPHDAKEAIVVIHGDHEYQNVELIEKELKQFDRAIIVIIGDESALFPSQRLVAPNRKIWHQVPIPGRHDFANRFLICGYPPDAPQYLERSGACGYCEPKSTRPLDWYFAGQITHARRVACAEQLRKLPNGDLLETSGFWQGYDREQYYHFFSHAKIIPCPSGPTTPDSFRVWEALEFGCLPIVDGTCPKFAYPHGYWKYVLGHTPPFPIIYDWADLPRIMKEEIDKWPYNRDCAWAWWQEYKKEMMQWVAQDLEALRRTC
jgi:hypothetical protein